MSRRIATNKSFPTEAEKNLNNTQKGKLLFTMLRGRMCAFFIQEDRLKAVQVLEEASGKIGAIYIAKVKNIVKNIEACFVEIADGEICFLPLKEASTAFLVNRTADGRLLEGDEVLVQVTRDAQKNKQASVTTKISLANDAFALSLGDSRIGYSSKLSKEQKHRIADWLEHNHIMKNDHLCKLTDTEGSEAKLPDISTGLVVRTLSKELTPEALSEAWTQLKTNWSSLLQTACHRTCFSCLVEPPAGFVTVLEHLVYNYEYEEILTDDATLYQQLRNYCEKKLSSHSVRLYEDTNFSLSKLYSLETKLDTALNTRIWLKSGGYLVIEPTEALTVIDVNSGKYEAKKSNAETFFTINQEAAQEVALQLRLRNLSGIIIVDFINMESKEQQLALLEQLKAAVRIDKQRVTVVDMTPLGLVEITRKKSHKTVREQF
ncbi:MAG: ribonuclease E/G [Lachnospiraceae bacterium]|nr:ribonuclease E/G [Lachnospiraceae bacterium]